MPLREAFISETSKICEIPVEKLLDIPAQPKQYQPSQEQIKQEKINHSINNKKIASL